VGSVELGWAFIDEAVEVNEADWIMVKGRLSWPGIAWHQLAAATNPASPAHWLKRRFTPPSPERVYLHASTLDNPALPADYVAEASAMGDGYFRQRYIAGEWVAAEGQIWQLPDAQIGTVAQQKWRRSVAGIDWGYQHPFACEVIVETGLGRRAVAAEVYVRSRTLKDIIPSLKAIQATWGVETFYADPSEPAYIDECRQAGLPVQEAVNDVLPGLTAVTEEIAKGLLVSPDCSGLLGELPGYVWASDRNGVRDVPVKQNDDACDALRYAVMGLRGAVSGNWSMVA
jgi:PBSX family phage terminase large subunit